MVLLWWKVKVLNHKNGNAVWAVFPCLYNDPSATSSTFPAACVSVHFLYSCPPLPLSLPLFLSLSLSSSSPTVVDGLLTVLCSGRRLLLSVQPFLGPIGSRCVAGTQWQQPFMERENVCVCMHVRQPVTKMWYFFFSVCSGALFNTCSHVFGCVGRVFFCPCDSTRCAQALFSEGWTHMRHTPKRLWTHKKCTTIMKLNLWLIVRLWCWFWLFYSCTVYKAGEMCSQPRLNKPLWWVLKHLNTVSRWWIQSSDISF